MPIDDVLSAKVHQGAANYHSGLAAEDCVARHYALTGATVLARRWRGRAGEVDLVLRSGEFHLFVEVKKAATFEMAAERLVGAQMARIASAAEEYMATLPGGAGGLIRIDSALVDGTGGVRIVENTSMS